MSKLIASKHWLRKSDLRLVPKPVLRFSRNEFFISKNSIPLAAGHVHTGTTDVSALFQVFMKYRNFFRDCNDCTNSDFFLPKRLISFLLIFLTKEISFSFALGVFWQLARVESSKRGSILFNSVINIRNSNY